MDYPFLKEVDIISLRCSLFDLDNAYNKFFKEKTGYPNFKSKFKKNSLLKILNIREYTCPNCQYELDRDYNASVNIMFEGLKIYMNEIRAQNQHQKTF